MSRREVDLVVISDVHLGTYGCHAAELLQYLRSIKPKRLVLNGDIIDIWQFKKRYWPKSHMKVIKHLTDLISDGVRVDYITGNHDELLRKFVGFSMGSFQISNKLLLKLDGKRTWIFHGDIFDVTMKHSRWLCKLGSVGYDILIYLNRGANYFSERMGKGKISLSKKIKASVKSAVKYISDFEDTAAYQGIDNGYDTVICGHIHQPTQRMVDNGKGEILYLNSGDWIENLTALEYHDGRWMIYDYLAQNQPSTVSIADTEDVVEISQDQLFLQILEEFTSAKQQEEAVFEEALA